MMKRIIVGIALLALFTIPLTACSQVSPEGSALVPSAENADNSSSIVVQSSLPLKVTEPADGATINGSAITVKGQTAPGATVIVNDVADVADENGDFSITISLNQGVNAIDVIATNDSGNEGEVLLMVNAVTEP